MDRFREKERVETILRKWKKPRGATEEGQQVKRIGNRRETMTGTESTKIDREKTCDVD